MKGFILVFDVEFNLAKRVNVDHIVSFFDNNSGTGKGTLVLSTGKQMNTAENAEELSKKILELEGTEILPVMSGPSTEELVAQMTRSLPEALKNLGEMAPRKGKKGKAEKISSPENYPGRDPQDV